MPTYIDMSRDISPKYDKWAKKQFNDTLLKFNIKTGEMIAGLYKDLALGRESKIRQALIDMGWTPPEDK